MGSSISNPTRDPTGVVTFEDEFTALFRDRCEPLYRYLSRLSEDPALAGDIVQDCFVKLYRRGAMPDDPGAWLVTVEHKLLRDDRLRVARRGLLLIPRAADSTAGDHAPEADAAALATERIESVRRALERLPLRDRQLLLLRAEGYAYREIAAALGLAPGSVGTMLAR